MRKVYVATNPADAHLLKGALEAEGISAVVQGDFLWNLRGEIPLAPETSPSVWIENESDYDRAREIVAALRMEGGSPEEAGPDWRCDGCGEMNESQYTECWQCGKDRPGLGE
ncbi:MAG: DUF2007 domain-containing protein [Desulfomonile tiedjei]|nr:DUF2007 domain-containing protein [Desulfomonile tiedjei]